MIDEELNEAVARKLGWKNLGPLKNPRTHETRPNLEGTIPDSMRQAFLRANPKGWISETYTEAVPAYSTDIKAAWEIVEHARSEYEFSMNSSPKEFWARFTGPTWKQVAEGRADIAPRAICKAFLKLP